MRILFVHQNFPGQFRHLATALAARPGHQVAALCVNAPAYPTPGVAVARYQPRGNSSRNIHRLATDIETKLIRGEAASLAAMELARRGFTPDLIVGHPGWGEMLFLREVWPKARQLHFLEFFYRAEGADYGFDPEFSKDDLFGRMRLGSKNLALFASLETMDWGLSPTEWQKSTLPKAHQDRISVIFDGIDTEFISPDAHATFELPDGRKVKAGEEVLTFVNRNLEPYRGFHILMRALPALQRARPEAITLIVGGDEVSYGSRPANAANWREAMLREVSDKLDLNRIFFLGRIPYGRYRQLLQVSRVHAYLTYPFVLSWSMLEAMAAECLVVGSATSPVEEALRHGRNGLVVPFFDVDAWVATLADALARSETYRPLRRQARLDVLERYDLRNVCLPAQLALVERLCA